MANDWKNRPDFKIAIVLTLLVVGIVLIVMRSAGIW